MKMCTQTRRNELSNKLPSENLTKAIRQRLKSTSHFFRHSSTPLVTFLYRGNFFLARVLLQIADLPISVT